MEFWTVFARDAYHRRIIAAVERSREAALSVAQRLWKRRLRPTCIAGPNGEIIGVQEIEAYGAAHPDACD